MGFIELIPLNIDGQ